MEASWTEAWRSITTVLPSQQRPVTLNLHSNHNENEIKFSLLLESQLFSSEEISELIELDLNSEESETKERNARLICIFLLENVRAKIEEMQSVELLDVENEIKDILRRLLSNPDIDGYIEQCEKSLDEESFKIESDKALNDFNIESTLLKNRYLALANLKLQNAARVESGIQKTALANSIIHKTALERMFSNPQIKMELLLEQMKNSQLFSALEMNEWKIKLRQINLLTKEKKEQEDYGLVLCLFLFELIRPALLATQDGAIKRQLLAFENTVKFILKEVLPSDQDINQFIAQFEGYLDQETVLKQKFDLMLTSFQTQINQFIHSANDVNTQINQNCLILKQRLKEVNEMRKLMSEELFIKFDALASRVDRLLEYSKKTVEDVHHLAERLQKEQYEFKQILITCENILNKV